LSLTLFVFAGNIGRRLLDSLPRHREAGQRCKGCGRKNLLGIAEQTMKSGNQLRVITGNLCTSCQHLVDRLRQDDRITGVFIFSRGKKTKYYAAFRNSVSS
jgi:CRISPR/Cas system-associated protein Cas10 (large subunit of type III CRISPR-Cas system)